MQRPQFIPQGAIRWALKAAGVMFPFAAAGGFIVVHRLTVKIEGPAKLYRAKTQDYEDCKKERGKMKGFYLFKGGILWKR